MRITASARSASRALKAATRRRWHISDSSRWRSSCQKTLRNVRGMPVAARIASSRRGLPAASRMIRWNASLAAMWSSASHSAWSASMSCSLMRGVASAAARGSSSARSW